MEVENIPTITPPAAGATPPADPPKVEYTPEKIAEIISHNQQLAKSFKEVESKLSDFQKKEDEAKKAQMSEIDRLKLEKQEAETNAQKRAAELEKSQFEGSVKLAAVMNGLNDENAINYALFLANQEKPADLKAFMESFKKNNPGLFKPVIPANSGVNDLNNKTDAKPLEVDIKNMSTTEFKAHMLKQGIRV